ncbi:nuclease SbcCD subunit C-like [Ochlerotatus camptorhynchus]|uniref:nuclease SbcCD subunit C-like n=1 Tax=Ochlerotatus camptorhynchus TaxID=644619 RepID=UPI0031D0EC5A
MAFSSQRTFLNVPFRNEKPESPDRKRSDCQLKSYESCTDSRAWSMDPKVSSKFLLDVAHKARFQSKLARPSGDCELTREYLQYLDVEELVDYVMSLMLELKKTKSQVQQLEADRKDLGERLVSVQQMAETCEQEKEELIVAQQQPSELLDQEMIELRNIILAMKEKADRYDCLRQENECMKVKLERFCDRNESTKRASFDEGACGDSVPKACERLKAELRLYKRHYDELTVQKRTLMEQLQRTKVREGKVLDLRNQLAEEEYKRESMQRQMDDLLIEYDRQALELKRKDEYIGMCNRRLERVELDRRPSSAPTGQRIIQRRSIREASRRSMQQ